MRKLPRELLTWMAVGGDVDFCGHNLSTAGCLAASEFMNSVADLYMKLRSRVMA